MSLTLTPMLCSRLLKAVRHDAHHNIFYRVADGGFNVLFRAIPRGIDLRHALAAGGAILTILSIAG